MIYQSVKQIWTKLPLLKKLQKKQDNRAYRFVAVIDCILNQNSRDMGAAKFPALNWPVLELCQKYNIGILQMPCPEIACLGFYRTRPAETSIRDSLDTIKGRAHCSQLSMDVVDKAEALCQQGAEFLAVLGGNSESPGCAVHLTDNSALPSGVFIKELEKELNKRHILVPFLAMRDDDPRLLAQDLRQLELLFAK